MRAAVFFGRARKIRTPGERGSSVPDDLLSAGDARCKHLIFEITVQQPGAFYHLHHPTGLTDIASQGLLACNADQFASSCLDRLADGPHMLQAEMVWAAEPDAVYLRRVNHLFNRIECPGFTLTMPACVFGCRFCVYSVWDVHTAQI